jgi:methionyl-tRNA formyltransferase
LEPAPQPTDGVSYAPKVSVDAARIRWDAPASAVDRHIRSVTPAPGAWTMIDGARVKIGPVRVEPESLQTAGVEVRKTGVYVGTATTAVRLDQVQPQGKRMMSALDWARGARLGAGTAIG